MKGVITCRTNNDNPVVQTADGYVELVKYNMVDYLDRPVDEHLVVGSRLAIMINMRFSVCRNEIEMIKQDLTLLKNENNVCLSHLMRMMKYWAIGQLFIK